MLFQKLLSTISPTRNPGSVGKYVLNSKQGPPPSIQETHVHQGWHKGLQGQGGVQLEQLWPQAHVVWITLHYRLQKGTWDIVQSTALLPEALNTFYAWFSPCVDMEAAILTLEAADVRRSFKAANPRKAPGQDGNPGRVLRVCEVPQLAHHWGPLLDTSNRHHGQESLSVVFFLWRNLAWTPASSQTSTGARSRACRRAASQSGLETVLLTASNHCRGW